MVQFIVINNIGYQFIIGLSGSDQQLLTPLLFLGQCNLSLYKLSSKQSDIHIIK